MYPEDHLPWVKHMGSKNNGDLIWEIYGICTQT